MMLNINPEKARNLLSTVEHETFTESLSEHWIVSDDGYVKAQSALWLINVNGDQSRRHAENGDICVWVYPL